MRVIIVKGHNIRELWCPFCGQIEKQTDNESDICLNCGYQMEPYFEDREKPSTDVEDIPKSEEPATVESPEEGVPEPPSVVESAVEATKKRGRPPKPREECCGNCSKALTTIGGFTCRDTMEMKKADDYCSSYRKGRPVK